MNGVLICDKKAGKTSHDAVSLVRRSTGAKKAGHTGTLDPMATGVLPVLLGSSTKLADHLSAGVKAYRARIAFGFSTDTLDVTGSVERTGGKIPDEAEFSAALEGFRGKISQTPPIYSAVKIKGKKLYEYARSGRGDEISEKIPTREIEIFEISGGKTETDGEFYLDLVCSKGTYVRSLCRDIAEKLGTFAAMSALRRTRSGFFDLSSAVTEEELLEISQNKDALLRAVIPNEVIAEKITPHKLTLEPFFTRLAKNGAEIYLAKLGEAGINIPRGAAVRLFSEDGALFALGEEREFAGGRAVKPTVFLQPV